MTKRPFVMFLIVGLAGIMSMSAVGQNASLIRPWPENPYYLAWDGTPVFPLGAAGYLSWHPISRIEEVDLEQQLDQLAQVIEEIDSSHVCGFVRCLPYDPLGGEEGVLQPWLKLEDGRYDLEQFSPEWEERLRGYLQLALDRRIVVSLEIWDDWSLTRGVGGAHNPGPHAVWNAHPFNPQNNINYDDEVLPVETRPHNPPFYRTIPSLEDNKTAFNLQAHYVDHLLSIATDYPNVMINLSNESRGTLQWSWFWADYIRARVPEGVMIGDMPSTNRRDGGGEYEYEFNPMTLSTDPKYDFVDISQGVSRHEFGSPHQQAIRGGERIIGYRHAMAEADTRRPLIVSKDYTNDVNGGDIVLWSRFVGGASTARFHRPYIEPVEPVIEFQHEAVGHLGQFIARVPFWRMHPDRDLAIQLPEGAEANILAEPNGPCVIQLLGGSAGDAMVLQLPSGTWAVEWIDPATGERLSHSEIATEDEGLRLIVPEGPEHQVIYVVKQ